MNTTDSIETADDTESFATEIGKAILVSVASTAGTLLTFAAFGIVVQAVQKRNEKKAATQTESEK